VRPRGASGRRGCDTWPRLSPSPKRFVSNALPTQVHLALEAAMAERDRAVVVIAHRLSTGAQGLERQKEERENHVRSSPGVR
jgi:hypothetical protein